MSESFDLSTLFFLALAVFVLLRLRGVLGRRTGNERPPVDPYSPRDAAPGPGDETAKEGKVITMPGTAKIEQAPDNDDELEIPPIWQGHAKPDSDLADGLEAIGAADKDFHPASFLEGAKAAYELIVSAFADGDRKTLKNLLSKEVFSGFESAITERQDRKETMESSFVGIDKATIIEAELADRKARVTIKFVSELISATKDSEGRVIDGDPKRVREVVDIWTFMRDTASRDPNWQLVATEAAN